MLNRIAAPFGPANLRDSSLGSALEVRRFSSLPVLASWVTGWVECAAMGASEEAAAMALFEDRAPLSEAARAEVFTRGRHLLAQLCSDGLPSNAEKFLETISNRLREESSVVVATPLVESLVVLTRTAAQREEYLLAINGAGVVTEIAEEFSRRGHVARQAASRLLKPTTLQELVRSCATRKDDPTVSRYVLPLLKRVGDPAARELLVFLEKEQVATRRLRILQVVKLLGRSAVAALSERLSAPQWYVVRNAVVALAELADPALLDRLEPALSHPEERVQQAAVTAVLRTQSPARALPLARALPAMKPAVLEAVLDDLLVLKEPQTVPHLEKFLLHPGDDQRPPLLQKAVAVLWSIGTEEAARALLNCANAATLQRSLRVAALRALSRLELPFARQALEEFVHNSSEAALTEEVRKLLGA